MDKFKKNSRKIAMENFDITNITKDHINLYLESIVSNQ